MRLFAEKVNDTNIFILPYLPYFNIENTSILRLFSIPDFLSYVCIECQNKDGGGQNKVRVNGQYTVQECIEAVKKNHATANGATSDKPCNNKCACPSSSTSY